MATNKLGPGTVNIGVNVPTELRTHLEQLAARSNMKLSAYVRSILQEAAKIGVSYSSIKSTEYVPAETSLPLAAEDRGAYNTSRRRSPAKDEPVELPGTSALGAPIRKARSA